MNRCCPKKKPYKSSTCGPRQRSGTTGPSYFDLRENGKIRVVYTFERIGRTIVLENSLPYRNQKSLKCTLKAETSATKLQIRYE